MIHEWQCKTVDHVLFASGAAELFNTHLSGARGPKSDVNRSVFLAGMLLGAMEYGQTHMRRMHSVLTHDVSLDWQYRWAVRKPVFDASGARLEDWVISESDLQNTSRRIAAAYSHTESRVPDPAEEPGKFAPVRAAQRANLYEVVDLIIEATLIPRPADSHDYCVDSSGIWAAQKYRKKLPDDKTADADVELPRESDTLAPPTSCAETEPTLERKKRVGRLTRTDATLGVKTAKNGGAQWYYGFALHAIVRSPALTPANGKRPEPALLERFRLTPASDDIVNVSLEIIDAVLGQGRRVRRLLVDRHYSFKKFDRWARELLARRIEQVLDLRTDEQGFDEWNGVLWAAGSPHCPSTPVQLGTIPKPGLNAEREEWDEFFPRIEQREAFSLQIRKPLDEQGVIRATCPARAGKVGCPLLPETMVVARELNLPIVASPPAGPLPTVCTQDSVGFAAKTEEQKSIVRLFQKVYWGSRKWVATNARRTFVEGYFGSLKGDSASRKKRGNHLYNGMAHNVLDTLAFGVASNVRHMRRWHAETGLGDPSNPLLSPATAPHVTNMQVTPEEYELLMAARGNPEQADAAA